MRFITEEKTYCGRAVGKHINIPVAYNLRQGLDVARNNQEQLNLK